MARTDPWTRACDKFKEDLSDEEKRLFSAASPENLFAGTLISYQQHEANSKSHKVVKALEPFVSIVRDYGAALDVLANTYSLVLSPLWGSIRIVLRLAEEAGKFFDKVLEMFNRIADVLPRLQVYERLFANHDRLLDMIFTAYLDILNFCIDAKGTLRKRGSLFKHLYWRPFQLRFQASLVSMRNHLKSVEKEAMLSHMIETSEERGLAKRDDVMGKEMIKGNNIDPPLIVVGASSNIFASAKENTVLEFNFYRCLREDSSESEQAQACWQLRVVTQNRSISSMDQQRHVCRSLGRGNSRLWKDNIGVEPSRCFC